MNNRRSFIPVWTNENDAGSGGVHVKFVPEVRMMMMSAHGQTASETGVLVLNSCGVQSSVRIPALETDLISLQIHLKRIREVRKTVYCHSILS